MKGGNYSWLVLAILLLLVGIPVAEEFDAISRPLSRAIAFSGLLGIGVLSLKGKGLLHYSLLVVVTLGILLNVAVASTTHVFVIFSSFAAIMTFLLMAIAVTFRNVATDREVSANRIVGAIAVYLLLGVLWAVAYTVADLIWPNSFTAIDAGTGSEWNSKWLYYSFVTMTTLGYGDISPQTPVAQLLAYMQAIFGQLYIAILVAGLVGAYISDKGRSKDARSE